MKIYRFMHVYGFSMEVDTVWCSVWCVIFVIESENRVVD